MHDKTDDSSDKSVLKPGESKETGSTRLEADQRHWAAEKVAAELAAKAKAEQDAPPIPEEVSIHLVPPPPPNRWTGIGKVLLLALIALTAWNVFGSDNAPTLTSREGEELAARFELYLLGREIHAYAEARGRLPESIGQIGELGDDIGYTANPDGTFTLSTQVSGGRVLYKPGTEDSLYEEMIERVGVENQRISLGSTP